MAADPEGGRPPGQVNCFPYHSTPPPQGEFVKGFCNSLLVLAYHLLRDETVYHELGDVTLNRLDWQLGSCCPYGRNRIE